MEPHGLLLIDQMGSGFKLITNKSKENQRKGRANARARRNPAAGRRARRQRESRSQNSGKKSVGSKIGGSIGELLGGAAQTLLGGIFGGRGEYEAHAPEDIATPEALPETNSLVNPVTNAQLPNMHSGAEGQTRIMKEEFIGDVVVNSLGTGGFVIPLDPSDPALLPWGSGIAKHYQKYSFLGLAFKYIPTSGYAVSGTPALGSVSMGCHYNRANPPTTDKISILALEGSVSCSPAAPAVCPAECAPDSTVIPVKYVDNGTGTTPWEVRELGNFYTVIQGCPTSASGYDVGELWVTYDIMYYDPQLPTPVALSITAEEKQVAQLLETKLELFSRGGRTGLAVHSFDTPSEYEEFYFKCQEFEEKMQSARIKHLYRLVRLQRLQRAEAAAKEKTLPSLASYTPPAPPAPEGWVSPL